MESHPIPQQISSYQFRLVGDMTLKQFFQIAGGALVSLLFYSLPIMGIIKWPLVLFFALLGIALAFLPLEDRPLERWIIAFFRAVYSPTGFFWKKTDVPQVFFQEEAAAPEEKIFYSGGEEKLQEYLNARPSDTFSEKLEKIESAFLSGVSGLINILPTGAPSPVSPGYTQVEQVPQIKQPMNIPLSTPPKLVVEESAPAGEIKQQIPITPVSPVSQAPGMVATKEAQFSVDAAPPNPPSTPNTLTGQVIDQNRKIVEGAIMEIRDSVGRPVRALKSNRLGHFSVVTPLQNGTYEIITEKDGFEFEPVSFETNGTIIPPIAISGKALSTPTVQSIQQTNKNYYSPKTSYPW